ncbi:rab-GTPase-TBC domain-containing protein [Aspergillus pseudonomiae]|uniref:Rab-GTPase-TBC domain-containing protein n=1 Tax=Aspergillus pseudonomiae TaxID=1506151 RepID=A0A5N6IHV6_9EURO|nr:rab-GTPase-TBC domain-containing protein [Aspergillus pseudonomiae]KAB8266332.1 rab-GTPase-TBC domain-containing protein [Aspergillus pseudonomiae]KAE8404487.1 rab-GTPase-TBC domain-containing protein [Aspergillus pseudonomiae]
MSESSSTIHAVAYEETVAAEAPLAVRSASLPTPVDHPLCSGNKSLAATAPSSYPGDPSRRPLSSHRHERPQTKDGRTLGPDAAKSVVSLRSLRSIPSIVVNDAGSRPSSRPGSRPGSRWSERKFSGLWGKKSAELGRDSESPPPVPPIEFNGLSLDIPNASFDGLAPQSMRFSKRGSLIKEEARQRLKQLDQDGGQEEIEKDPIPPSTAPIEQNDAEMELLDAPVRRSKLPPSLRARRSAMPSRVISADEDMLSRRVRLMYEKGDENVTDSEVAKALAVENGVLWEEGGPASEETSRFSGASVSGTETKSIVSSVDPEPAPSIKKEPNELAGGIEYWHNIKAGDVDRYGFIRSPTSNSNDGTEPSPIQRVSTSLLLASESPRRKYSIRPPSALGSNRSFAGRSPNRKICAPAVRPSSSQSAYSSPVRRSTSRFRQATNHLPHNRDRRFKDEAADMLTHPVDSSRDRVNTAAMSAAKKREWRREDKWTKMARQTKSSRAGGGMTFEFDTKSSKLIERTWKGIPDRWRSTAWYSFLEASAKKRSDSPTVDELIDAYHEYQFVSSPDDVQIDIDVPRTITSHIMFRRRYRGGQRLLFRVLHAMSLYFPDTGYVQGMAALAATLLAYYDEEHAFIMLVRLWQLRGLEQLYRSGFEGLMEALADFERGWLEGGEVAMKLNELGIPPTAYGTRWYLTLFNYSIPFPAQLRVWDVFMLLGDAEDPAGPGVKTEGPDASAFGKGLDVLHATSAALIDGMREIILESDFENAMKVLTSWVPIKDVELFMRVAKAEWKVHRRKKALA